MRASLYKFDLTNGLAVHAAGWPSPHVSCGVRERFCRAAHTTLNWVSRFSGRPSGFHELWMRTHNPRPRLQTIFLVRHKKPRLSFQVQDAGQRQEENPLLSYAELEGSPQCTIAAHFFWNGSLRAHACSEIYHK